MTSHTMYRPDWDTYFIEIAKAVALRASCPRLKVGAVLVDGSKNFILGTGYNGAESGKPSCFEVGFCEIVDGHCKRAVHAERNAVDWAIRQGANITGAKLYCTVEPCSSCRGLLDKYHVGKVTYLDRYRDYSIEANMPAFQAGDEGSIPSSPSKNCSHKNVSQNPSTYVAVCEKCGKKWDLLDINSFYDLSNQLPPEYPNWQRDLS